MPLRDHFHAPLGDRRRWEGFHSLWPGVIVQHLSRVLPSRYYAEPRVHLGTDVEIDVAALEDEETGGVANGKGNGIATAAWAPPRPIQTFSVDFPAQDTFEVLVYDERRHQRLVAAVELVSPANKDRPDHRRDFVVKCASLLQERIALVVVDIVTERHADLHAQLLQILGLGTPAGEPDRIHLHASVYRTSRQNDTWRMDLWPHPLVVGALLPTLPLWLAADLAVPLELEASYEETCRALRIV
jgi:hypothetical protein